jgi:hypothetical protein
MRTRLLPLAGGSMAGLKVYARWDATIDYTGGGGAKNEGANDARTDPPPPPWSPLTPRHPPARSRRRSPARPTGT